jgi:tetratricopeptide (TPR) repeat protein
MLWKEVRTMKYILALTIAFLAAPAIAQNAPGTVGKDIRQQTQEELAVTAGALEEAVKLRPAEVDLRVKLGFTYTRLGKADEARRAFESAVSLDPKKAIAHYMLGLIYEKLGLREKAVAAWKACLENAAEPQMRDTAAKHLHHLSHQ